MTEEELPFAEKVKQTKYHHPTLPKLREAVINGSYHNKLSYFSRSFLWRSLSRGKFISINEEEELKLLPVPKEADIHAQKEILIKETTNIDPLTSNNISHQSTDSLEIIQVDVPRLLLDPIFTENSTIQSDIIELLYNYDLSFTSYRQGYHELLGLVYLILDREGKELTRSQIKKIAFSLFVELISPVVSNFYIEDSLLGWCTSIFNRNLLLVDPPLYELLLKYNHIESQLWLIRWVRLLFIRELGLDNATRLIDLMWCYDSKDITRLIPYIIIVLLIRIKMSLVECEDQGEVLYLLLHYPFLEYSDDELRKMVQFSIEMDQCDQKALKEVGVRCNSWYHQGVKWEKIKDLGKLRLELKLRRRVRGALKK